MKLEAIYHTSSASAARTNQADETRLPRDFMWVVIESALLDGEQVVIVSGKRFLREARNANPGRVLYFPPEIEELKRFQDDPDAIKAMHRIKKHLGAWIVPSKLSTSFPQRHTAGGGTCHGQH